MHEINVQLFHHKLQVFIGHYPTLQKPRKVIKGATIMKQLVLPIKDSNVLHEVEDTLLHNFKAGRRNYTIFQVGKATLLRVSDVLALERSK
jgi:hypothetical protein